MNMRQTLQELGKLGALQKAGRSVCWGFIIASQGASKVHRLAL